LPRLVVVDAQRSIRTIGVILTTDSGGRSRGLPPAMLETVAVHIRALSGCIAIR
jgi:hypothetical protein